VRLKSVLALLLSGVTLAACGSTTAESPSSSSVRLSAVKLPSVTDQLNSVSCSSPTFCLAVGSSGTGAQYLIGSLSGLHHIAGPELPKTSFVSATAVQCTPSDACIVSGSDGGEIFEVTYSHGGWSKPTMVSPKGADALAYSVTGMDCVSANKCLTTTTLTRTNNGATDGAIVDVEQGARSPVFTLTPKAPYVSSSITGVSCPSTTTCFASAYETTRGGVDRPIILKSNSPYSTWIPISGLRFPSGSVALNSISCQVGGACGAGGVWHDAGASKGVLAVRTASRWQVKTVNDPTGAQNI
jgi:hypothetical protein